MEEVLTVIVKVAVYETRISRNASPEQPIQWSLGLFQHTEIYNKRAVGDTQPLSGVYVEGVELFQEIVSVLF